MITALKNLFRLDTPNTTYIFRVTEGGFLQQLYYGGKIGEISDVSFLVEKQGSGQGTAIAVGEEKIFPDNTCLECSSVGRGDYRESLVVISDQEENTVNDFRFENYSILENFEVPDLPTCYGKEQTLAVNMLDKAKQIRLTLYYSTLSDCDVIVKSVSVTNLGSTEVRLLRAMSNQLDLPTDCWTLDTLDGAWGRERYINSEKLRVGITKTDSKRGISSNTHNPFVVLRSNDSNSFYGEAYGFNLVYSGNHEEIFDKTPLGKVRVLNGINENGFCWHLAPSETFYTPEATLCYSDCGTNTLSQRYHKFVNEHVVPQQWAYRERPILVNNWEATYFDFTEKKLLDIAKTAKSLGVELFVLDDGWFGQRTNDTRGLGDWTVNPKRLKNGLEGLAKKIKGMGLQFGVWVEPEMVNPDSDLYRAHPDWAVTHPSYEPLLCRNQLLLDLSNPEVCNYIIDAMTKVFSTGVNYVKWDFNRPLTDFYSPTLGEHQGEFLHRFILGYYKVVKTLTERFPDILFESCASGGNRVDLGVIRYMPQFWCSDNTDSFDRVKIHEGTLYGYPPSCIGSHVSASPNHQTLRHSTIDNRFNTACIGAFGYELDLATLNKVDADAVKNQLKWYKKYRRTLQFGRYFRLRSVFEGEQASWALVNDDGTQAVINLTNGIAKTIPPQEILRVPGLLPEAKYVFETRPQVFSLKTFGGLVAHYAPVHLKEDGKLMEIIDKHFPMKTEVQRYELTGEMLAKCGVKLNQQWGSTGYDGNTRVMLDFGSRLYSADKMD